MFESADDQDEMTVRLAEIIKAKSSEYHQCESRIENLTKKLQGDRGERMKNRQKATASFLSIVQLFQEEEERKNMVRIAEMQKELIKEEAKKIEGMSDWKARVLGINVKSVVVNLNLKKRYMHILKYIKCMFQITMLNIIQDTIN
jgi:Skp family chaperone for outer membrane proteins